MKSRGDVETLTDHELAEALGISDEQKERIKKRAEEIKAEVDEEIAQLKKKARQKLLHELTPKQRKQLEKMLGTEFDDKPIDQRKRVEHIRKSSKKKNP